MDSGLQVLDSSLCQWDTGILVDTGFYIIVSGIPDSKGQDPGIPLAKFPGFRNPDSLTWGKRDV